MGCYSVQVNFFVSQKAFLQFISNQNCIQTALSEQVTISSSNFPLTGKDACEFLLFLERMLLNPSLITEEEEGLEYWILLLMRQAEQRWKDLLGSWMSQLNEYQKEKQEFSNEKAWET